MSLILVQTDDIEYNPGDIICVDNPILERTDKISFILVENKNGQNIVVKNFKSFEEKMQSKIQQYLKDNNRKIDLVVGVHPFADYFSICFNCKKQIKEGKITPIVYTIFRDLIIFKSFNDYSYNEIVDILNDDTLREYDINFYHTPIQVYILRNLKRNKKASEDFLNLLSPSVCKHDLKYNSLIKVMGDLGKLDELIDKLSKELITKKSLESFLVYMKNDFNLISIQKYKDKINPLIDICIKRLSKFVKNNKLYSGIDILADKFYRERVDWSIFDKRMVSVFLDGYVNVFSDEEMTKFDNHKYSNMIDLFNNIKRYEDRIIVFLALINNEELKEIIEPIATNTYVFLATCNHSELPILSEQRLELNYIALDNWKDNFTLYINRIAEIIEESKNKHALRSFIIYFNKDLLLKYLDLNNKKMIKKQLLKLNLSDRTEI